MEKLKSFIKGNKGCLYLIVVFGLLVLSIRACDYYDDIETDHFYSLKNEADSLMYKGEYERAIEKYESALKIHSSGTNYTLPSYSGLANCYELLGKYDSALYYLDKYDAAAGGTCFSNIHRAIIYAKKNDSQTSRNLLDRILNQPLEFDQPSLWATLTDGWLHSKSEYSESKAYLEYVFHNDFGNPHFLIQHIFRLSESHQYTDTVDYSDPHAGLRSRLKATLPSKTNYITILPVIWVKELFKYL